MVLIKDLSIAEVINIAGNKDDFNRIIDYECAVRGIQLLPEHYGNAPDVFEAKEDIRTYKVGDYIFEKSESAQIVIDTILSQQPMRVERNGEHNVIRPLSHNDYYYPKLITASAMTVAQYDKIKDLSKQASEIMKVWTAKKNEYEQINSERKEVIAEFNDRAHIASQVMTAIGRIEEEFNRYVDLADGNETIGVKFLLCSRKDGSLSIDDNLRLMYIDTNNDEHFTGIVLEKNPYEKKDDSAPVRLEEKPAGPCPELDIQETDDEDPF
jgi:hypothetical protein